MMDWGSGHGWGYMHGFGWMFGLLVWVVIIVAIVAVLRLISSKSAQNGPPPAQTALEILDQRFARGEIDQQEYEQKRRVLKENQ